MSLVDSVGNWAPRKTLGTSLSSICEASCSAVLGRFIYTFGGFHLYSATVNNNLFVLDTETLIWSKVEHIRGDTPCARYGHSITLWGADRLIVFGGCDSADAVLNDVHVLNLSEMVWERLVTTGEPPAGRNNHSATISNGKLYIHEWSGPIKITGRYNHLSFVYRNCFYIYGGSASEDKFQNTDEIVAVDLEDYEASTLSISSRQSPPKLGRRFAQICGNKLVVVNSSFSPRSEMMKSQVRAFPTGVWSLNLHTFKWKRHDDGLNCLDQGSWHYCAMSPNDSKLILLGVSTGESMAGYEESVDDYLGWMLKLNIGSFGIQSVPESTMMSDFEALFMRENSVTGISDTTDFTIHSKGDPSPIKVHQLILNARWPHFAAVVRSGMAESAASSITLPESRTTILGFLKYLYTDSLLDLSDDTVADLMVMGNVYCLERLQKLACSILHERLTIENVARVFLRASRAGEVGLRERALALSLERFGEVSRTVSFRSLSKDELDELLDGIPVHAGMSVSKDKTSPRKRPIALVDNDGEGDLEVDIEPDVEMEADTDAEIDVDAEADPDSDT
ncbi:hypothetical protein HDU67_001687, partial [Dinochytrium kinnereticum]